MDTIDLDIDIAIPYLWDDSRFKKSQWGYINFLIGPNGTGKTVVAERIRQKAEQDGLNPRYLNAERCVGRTSPS